MSANIMDSIIKAVPSMGLLGAVFAGGLAYASVKFAVDEDPRKGEIEDVLPGANCGACGYPGCSSFAEAIVNNEAAVSGCPVGGEETAEQIADIMGVEVGGSEASEVAQILCQGGTAETYDLAEYEGIATCQAADMEPNIKSCAYGCLGFGDCVEVCPFDAIVINDNGLPEVDIDACTGCGKCVEECPRDIIELVADSQPILARCNSVLQGGEVTDVCEVGCIGCSVCANECPVDAIEMEANLPVVDEEKCIDCGACVANCPTDSMVATPFETRTEPEAAEKKIIITDDCIGCTACKGECPVDAISGEQGEQHEIDQDLCIQCENCVGICPQDAIKVKHN